MYLLGIDIGTTNWKAVLYTYQGEPVAQSSMPAITHHGEAGQAVYETEEIWDGVRRLLQEILALCQQNRDLPVFSPEKITGVAVTGMGESMVPLDYANRPLYPAIAWFDPRTVPQYEWLRQYDQQQRIYRTTGLSHHHIYSLCKLLWIREHEPTVFANAVKWLTMPDFVLFKLSGEYATEYSEASRTMCFDLVQRQWADWIFELLNMEHDRFPPAYPSGTIIGRVHSQAAQETGLAVGTPVVTGGHDHICAALAVGAFQPGECLDSCGTTESLVLPLKTVHPEASSLDQQLVHGCHVAREMYYVIVGLYAAGSELQWYKEQFTGIPLESVARGQVSDSDLWNRVMNEAQSTPPGADGVFFLPHSRGSNVPPADPHSCGTLLGLRSHHHRGHILRAVTEGLCYEARRLLKIMEEYAGISVKRLRLVGNARNTFWLQVKADILNCCIEVSPMTEGGCLGAALLAGIGTGVYRNEHDAFARTYRPGKIYEPTQAYTRDYDRFYHEVFTAIYPAVAPVYRKIAETYQAQA